MNKFRIALLAALVWVLAGSTSFADYILGMAGGSGGRKNTDATCLSGYVPVGLRVSFGSYVHSLNFMCGQLVKNSRLGRDTIGTVRLGNSAGALSGFNWLGANSTQTAFCPNGYVVAGVKWKAGTYVDRVMTLRCQALNGTTLKYVGVGLGGKGGTEQRHYCRSGDRVSKITVHYGQWVDAVVTHCN